MEMGGKKLIGVVGTIVKNS